VSISVASSGCPSAEYGASISTRASGVAAFVFGSLGSASRDSGASSGTSDSTGVAAASAGLGPGVALGLGLGLDYAFSRQVAAGVTLRFDQALTRSSASTFDALLRVEYRWGW